MLSTTFLAFGHENITGEHKTTLELTSEDFLTPKGSCIVGIKSTLTLNALSLEIKQLACLETTQIVLIMKIDEIEETVTGHGGPGLTYSDSISMVARTSSFQCARTLMINADKATSDLSRDFIEAVKNRDAVLTCELRYIT